MRWFLNNLVFLIFFCWPLQGEEIIKNYTVKTSGLKIGELSWKINSSNNNYTNKLSLKNAGLLSSLYSFKGSYYAEGKNFNNNLSPKKYTHFWKTKKTIKNMELSFNKNKLQKINQEPVEKEKIKLDVFGIQNIKDPLTSFLSIMMGKKEALVVDGRRLYKMKAKHDESLKKATIEISDYFNLWADHKRNKFEKIIFEKRADEILPFKMLIFFDGRVFSLDEN